MTMIPAQPIEQPLLPDGGLELRAANDGGQSLLDMAGGNPHYLVISGGRAYSPGAYMRSSNTMREAWRAAVTGANVANQQLGAAYGVSVTGYACTNYKADTASDVPLQVMNPAGNPLGGGWHPLHYFLMHGKTLLWLASAALDIYGVSYFLKLPNKYGVYTGLQWQYPDEVYPEKNVDGDVRVYWIDNVPYPANRVVVVKSFDPMQSDNGKSPFEVVMSRILTEQNVMTYSAAFFFNGARPDGILTPKGVVNEAAIEKARLDWKKFKGADKAFKAFISSGEWTWTPVSAAPKDLAMQPLKDDIRKDVCIAFNVDPALIGAGNAGDPLSANSTRESIKRNHAEAVTIPRVNIILEALNSQWAHCDFAVPSYYTLTIDKANMPILSNVTSERVGIANNMTASGLATFNEGRGHVGLPTQEVGANLNLNPVHLNAALGATAITINEWREMQALKPWGVNGDVVMIGGQPIPVQSIAEYAQQTLEGAGEPEAPSGGFNPFWGLSHQPAPETAERRSEFAEEGTPSPSVSDAQPLSVRQYNSIEIAVDLSSLQAVRYARRDLSKQLAEADVHGMNWFDSSDWRVVLLRATGVYNPHVIAAALKRLRFDDNPRLTLQGRYFERDLSSKVVYLTLARNDALHKLTAIVRMEAADVGIDLKEPEWLGVQIGTLDQVLPTGALEARQAFPVPINNLTLRADSAQVYKWTLRLASPEQMRELGNWQRKVTRKGREQVFIPEHLVDNPLVNSVRLALVLQYPVEQVFNLAGRVLRGEVEIINEDEAETPSEYEAYWNGFDKLAKEFGDDWLTGYMGDVWQRLEANTPTTANDVEAVLVAERPELVDSWVGTLDDPGPLMRMILAGMAAGNEAILNGLDPDYRAMVRQIAVATSWELMSQQAYDHARSYSLELIRGLDATTKGRVQDIIAEWVESGEPMAVLQRNLREVFHDKKRADMIGQTEGMRAYNHGAYARWEDVGVTQATWITVRDNDVCAICEGLDGMVGNFTAEGWTHPGGEVEGVDASKYSGKSYKHPAHPRCRCYSRPVVDDLL